MVTFMMFAGITSGFATSIAGSLWAELYGTKYLGEIKSVVTSGVIASTALSPGLMGYLISQKTGDLNTQISQLEMECPACPSVPACPEGKACPQCPVCPTCPSLTCDNAVSYTHMTLPTTPYV